MSPSETWHGAAPLHHSSRQAALVRGAWVLERPERAASAAAEARVRDVVLWGGRVAAMGQDLTAPHRAIVVDGTGLWLLPAWIDIQANDLGWLAQGHKGLEEHAARIREVVRFQAARGVTGLVLATLAAPLDEVLEYLRGMRRAQESQGSPLDAVFLGGLVEGTFLNPGCAGAHNARWVLPPSLETLDRLVATQAVRLLNVAPEMSPEATDVIARAAALGIVVGAGHARPTAARLREAVHAGLRYAIHLGNGPTGTSLKTFHDGGMLEEALRNDSLVASVIADGVHIHPAIIRDWIVRKEVHRVVAVSDTAFSGEEPPGEFEVFGIRGERSADGRYLRVVPPPGSSAPSSLSSDVAALFASVAGMREVFETLINTLTTSMEGVSHRRHPALELPQACEWASLMTSANPARLLGLEGRGVLREGARADAVLLDIQGSAGAYRVQLRATWCG